jgi:hypothetical protein
VSYCVEELIVFSYNYYKYLLNKTSDTYKITIICGGQSPTYYCLAMMNYKIYNPDRVNIIVLPHSMGGDKSVQKNTVLHSQYCNVLKKKINIEEFYNNIVILDGVHTGAGVSALKAAISYCIKSQTIEVHAMNILCKMAQIYVDEEFVLQAEPKFADTFPRLIVSYKAQNFGNEDKFIPTLLVDSTNKIAQFIIDVSKVYPETDVRDTEWFKLNTSEPIHEPLEYKSFLCTNQLKMRECFKPKIVMMGDSPNTYKVYKCPTCGSISGMDAVKNPTKFMHFFKCEIKNKIPDENCETA